MSILIKGMKMPESCEDCPLIQTDENYYGDVMSQSCNLIYKGYLSDVPHGERRKDCPLIEVPPHGDLIDREPFIEFIEKNWDSYDQWFIGQLEARPIVIPADKDGET